MFIGGFELTSQFQNLFNSFFDKLDSAITSNFSYFNNALNYVVNLFNYLGKIIVWLSSYSGLSVEVITIIIGLISGGIGIIISSFVIKLIIKWWSVLVP